MGKLAIGGDKNVLTVYIECDIDHHNASSLRNEIDEIIIEKKPRTLMLNFDGTAFMDSSGIGLILGRYKLLSSYGAKLRISGLNERCRRLVEMSGILSIVEMVRSEQ